MAKAVIVCSGATMGTAAGVRHYANTMLDAMRTAPSNVRQTLDESFPSQSRWCSWLSRVLNTHKVTSSNLVWDNNTFWFFGGFFLVLLDPTPVA